jgi:glycosyltransferase involved in cell wall biosynthesis
VARRPDALRVLLLNQHYPPDEGATGRLLADLAQGLAARGHDITVLTGRPNYASSRRLVAPTHEKLHGVHVVRVPMARRREGFLGRGIHYASFALTSWARGFFVRRPDVIVAFSSTPAFGGVSALCLARALRRPFIYCVEDVHPEIAAALGALRGRRVIRVLRAVEAMAWRRAERLVLIGDDLRAAAAGRGVDASRVVTIANWADTSRITPRERSAFREQMGLKEDHFVVQYAGNLGRAQDLDTVVAATTLAHRSDERVRLLCVGAGSSRSALSRVAEASPGVLVADFQPEERVADVLAAADVSLVPLRAGLSRWCVPSKVYSILASGRAVGAVVDRGSEVARVVDEACCGFRVDPGDAPALAREILRLASDRASTRRLGANGRSWLERNGALSRALDAYEGLLEEVVSAVKEVPTPADVRDD